MITCNKCHKAIKSDTADEFCKCCYPEPEEVPNPITILSAITPLAQQTFNAWVNAQNKIAEAKEEINNPEI